MSNGYVTLISTGSLSIDQSWFNERAVGAEKIELKPLSFNGEVLEIEGSGVDVGINVLTAYFNDEFRHENFLAAAVTRYRDPMGKTGQKIVSEFNI